MLFNGNVLPHASQGNTTEAMLMTELYCRVLALSRFITCRDGTGRYRSGFYFWCAIVSHMGKVAPGADARGGTELISSNVAGMLLAGRVTPCSVFCNAKVVCLFLACAPWRLPSSEEGTPS